MLTCQARTRTAPPAQPIALTQTAATAGTSTMGRADLSQSTGLVTWWLILAAVAAVVLTGCRQEAPVMFEPNLVQSMKYTVREGLPMDQASQDALWIVNRMFGTPDQPTLPQVVLDDQDLSSIVSMEHLEQAAGPADASGRGLYRKHCAICHGVTGDGRGGETAVQLPVYPRDYRKGIFKFKSTPRGAKPTHEDIAFVIRNGITPAGMVKIPELSEDEIKALTDYVIYLSWRGELERRLLDDVYYEDIDVASGERLINTGYANSSNEDEKSTFEEQWGYAQDHLVEIGESWLDAPDQVVEVPEPPTDLPVPADYDEFVKLSEGDQADALAKSVAHGRELFASKVTGCSKCHGETGKGDGQNTDYDDWTKDWTTTIGLKPEDRESLIPLLARGALPPKNAKPRNFSDGLFHGGGSPQALYRRITQGIDGTPMPAATFVPGEFEADDVWDLINFIRSLKTPPADDAPSELSADA